MKNKIIGISNFTIEFYDLFFNIADNLLNHGYEVIFLFPNNTLKIILKNRGYYFIDKKQDFEQKKTNLQKILFWESSSKNSRYLIKIAKQENIKILFFENGYFPNTLQIDEKGQNKKSSIYDMNYEEILSFSRILNNKDLLIDICKFRLSHLEKLKILFNIRYTLQSIWNYINFKRLFFIRKKKLKKEESNILKNGKYIFIPFQVHDDSQILLYSNIIKKMDNILDFFYNDIKKILPNYKIIVKEHPMDLGRIDYSLLRKKYQDVLWFQGGDLEDIIEKSEYVIVINSSVGLQCLEKGKKILLLGNAIYENNPFVEKISSISDFSNKLEKLKNKEFSKKDIYTYISKFKHEIFFSGSYKNFNNSDLKKILNYILK